jgi:hypothetical protein
MRCSHREVVAVKKKQVVAPLCKELYISVDISGEIPDGGVEMMDLMSYAAPELLQTIEAEREHQRRSGRWRRKLAELRAAERRRLSPAYLEQKRREFRRALDAAQAAGVTVDAWMTQPAVRIVRRTDAADAALSQRADWAGLNDAA